LIALLAALAPLLGAASPPAEAPRREDAARLMNELMSGRARVGGPIELSDQWGRVRSLADFRGKLVLLYFGFASCPDVCPTDLAVIGEALRRLGRRAEEVQPLFITLDPQRDTVEVLREYVAAFHPRFVALRGSEAQTREVATRYKVFYEKVPMAKGYAIDHMAFTFVLDREGRYVAFLPPGTSAERMASMVSEAL
jgi:cytochrome oxidase Cu insertion factor (SCO1/SenC/PrrC family)